MTTDQELDLLSEYMKYWIDYIVKCKLDFHLVMSTWKGTSNLLMMSEDELPFPTFESWKELNYPELNEDTSMVADTNMIAFCNWSKEAEWRDGLKQLFIRNDWEGYIQEFNNRKV